MGTGGAVGLAIIALVALAAAVYNVSSQWTSVVLAMTQSWAGFVDMVSRGSAAILRAVGAAMNWMEEDSGVRYTNWANSIMRDNARVQAAARRDVAALNALLKEETLAAGGTGRMAGAGDALRRAAEIRAMIASITGGGGGPGEDGLEKKKRPTPKIFEFQQSVEATYRWARMMDEQAAAVESRFAEMANNITDSLTNLFSDVLMGQADAFERFLATIERMLADFAARQLVNSIGRSIGRTITNLLDLGGYMPLGGQPAASLTGARPAALAGGDSFHVNVSFAPSFIDARSGAAWLRENEGVITEAVINGVRKSGAARQALVGR